MGEDEKPITEGYSKPLGMGKEDYDAILSTRRELTSENLRTAGDLIDIAMKIVSGKKVDKKTGFKTVYVKTGKIDNDNLPDPNGSRFYVLILDSEAGKKPPNFSKGLFGTVHE